MNQRTPLRGEVRRADFSPTKGREQAGIRPALIISVDDYNRSPSGLVVVIPITNHPSQVPWHVPLPAGEGGLRNSGAVLCDHLRSIGVDRLIEAVGVVSYSMLEETRRRLRYLMEL
jgi:mRNA interferase MazF